MTVKEFNQKCRILNGLLPTLEDCMKNYERLMASGQAMPERILNVPLPPFAWSIDAGTD